MAKIHLYHVILGGNTLQVGRLENDHMRLRWDARKRRLIAVYVADEIFLLQSPGKLSFRFALRCTRTCHTQGLTPVSRLGIGGCGCLVPGIFPGPQADWTPLRPPPLP